MHPKAHPKNFFDFGCQRFFANNFILRHFHKNMAKRGCVVIQFYGAASLFEALRFGYFSGD
jgi:hypothetical protein